MALTDTAIRQIKPVHRPRKLFDGGGLYPLVSSDQGKYWRLKHRFGVKEKSRSFGVYPHVTLAAARNLRDEARAFLDAGVDPSEARKDVRAANESKLAGRRRQCALPWAATAHCRSASASAK
ncbi:Arm DNA-binding domain-containing protein [Paraburkholderia sp. SIMBA_061]